MSEQRVAIITGASRGIGAAIARELAAQGARVVVNYTSRKDGAEATAAAIRRAGGEAFVCQADVQNADALDTLFAETKAQYGRLDILVNNAGVGATAPIEALDAALIDAAIGVNLKGMLLATRRAVQAFGPDGGAIVSISSAIAAQPLPGQAVYAASKAAIEAATRCLAQELGAKKIRVNAVAPGSTDTDLLPKGEEIHQFIQSRTALGRVGQPDDIAKVVAFLASDAGAWITGQVIAADGGLRL